MYGVEMVNRQRNNRGRFVTSKPIDVRNENQANELEAMIHAGPITFVLIYADWCGHCTRYKPTWHELEKTPGRTANIASVHHDMVEKIPSIANAKIQGYPSVIKVKPSGAIEEYNVPGSSERTNAIPNMRNSAEMRQELVSASPNSGTPGTQSGLVGLTGIKTKESLEEIQKGGASVFSSVTNSFVTAFKKAIPSTFSMLRFKKEKRRRTYKSPKKASRRAHSRRVHRIRHTLRHRRQ